MAEEIGPANLRWREGAGIEETGLGGIEGLGSNHQSAQLAIGGRPLPRRGVAARGQCGDARNNPQLPHGPTPNAQFPPPSLSVEYRSTGTLFHVSTLPPGH